MATQLDRAVGVPLQGTNRAQRGDRREFLQTFQNENRIAVRVEPSENKGSSLNYGKTGWSDVGSRTSDAKDKKPLTPSSQTMPPCVVCLLQRHTSIASPASRTLAGLFRASDFRRLTSDQYSPRKPPSKLKRTFKGHPFQFFS